MYASNFDLAIASPLIHRQILRLAPITGAGASNKTLRTINPYDETLLAEVCCIPCITGNA